jgi:hypothetical protein
VVLVPIPMCSFENKFPIPRKFQENSGNIYIFLYNLGILFGCCIECHHFI